MAEGTNENGSSAVASVAIVVLVIIAIIAAYFLFFADRTGDPGPAQPDLEIEINGIDD